MNSLLQDQLKKVSAKISQGKENNYSQHGTTHCDEKTQLIENNEPGRRGLSDQLKQSPEGEKKGDSVKRMSELVSRNPLYTSLHR